MYKRLSAVMFPIVTLLCIGSIVWGYQEHQEKNSILLKAENQYQRAFHDLTYHMDKLHNELGQTLAVHSSSQGMHRKGLVNVWRLTSEAQNEINQLPLTLLPFNQTEDFLSRISNFAYKTAVRDMTKEPLSPDEMKTLKTLYASSKQISKDLFHVQDKVIQNRLRWMDVESALATEKESADNTIADGFKTVDNKVNEYPEINWGPSVSSIYSKRSVRMLQGPPATPEQLKEKGRQFMKPHQVKAVNIKKNGNSADHETYTVSANHAKGDGDITIDFTKQGMMMSYLDTRTIKSTRLSGDDAEKKASAFLTKYGYPTMKAVRYQDHNNVESFTFVPVKNNVYMYPQQIQVRVALDNGDITGVQASDYIYSMAVVKSVSLKPKLTVQQAKEHVNSDMKVAYTRLAVIKNDASKEVLCYEFGGTYDKQGYRIYVNADTGMEESVESVSS
ncbi:germination protein YpeB [Paenibacillus sp. UMB4589-SE434]|uniref:germination protein YpeB n=1 Tax=Paenibacillus sp. UMB4589-SE434 TaxID=3046314 RepID=UPI00254D170C|nr:germination protein YpeB [Paenibacillus sp. UMB4589-SE434]MDK8179453.1 germination protein YpeB [Paenibacillus sp. UMB4589-SE434]